MRTSASARITYTWVVACLLTVASGWLGLERGGGPASASTAVTVAVLAIGFIKARCITEQFMEVRTAPRWLRRFTTTWLLVLWATILAIYLA
jgi:hypothetical protein